MTHPFENTHLFIYGDGGHAREIGEWFREYQLNIVDVTYITENSLPTYDIDPELQQEHILGVGKPELRKKIVKSLPEIDWMQVCLGNNNGYSIFCPFSFGTVFSFGCVVAPNSHVDSYALINYNATVGHDAKIGKYSVISPNSTIGGWCEIGECVYVGAGANIREGVKIGSSSVVGMGATVTKDIPDDSVVVNVNEVYTKIEWSNKNGR